MPTLFATSERLVFRTTALLIVYIALLGCAVAHAQTTSLDDARVAFRALQYPQARTLLEQIIADPVSLTTDDLAESHLILGSILYSENQPESARQHFSSALQLSPTIQLTSIDVSPKIVDFFEDVRAQTSQTASPAQIRYVTLYDRRPAAAMRSVILPGWGQYYKGENAKAFWLLSGWTITAGGTVVTHLGRRAAKNRYVDETDRELVPDRFQSYNNWHKARGGFALAAGAVWLYSYVDAMIRPSRVSIGRQGSQISLMPTPFGVRYSVSIPIRKP